MPSSKVASLIDKYNLEDVGDELEVRWTADTNRMSLRELADYFNKRLLKAVLVESQVTTLTGEVDTMYHSLTDDTVTSGTRTQAKNRLREHDVDVAELCEDFVSRQAIHTYLTKHREATYDGGEDDDDVVERRLDEIQRLRNRLSAVTERALSSLEKKSRISLGDFHVLVSVQIQCSDCETQLDVTQLLKRGGCDCK
jgi:hypothetical protein